MYRDILMKIKSTKTRFASKKGKKREIVNIFLSNLTYKNHRVKFGKHAHLNFLRCLNNEGSVIFIFIYYSQIARICEAAVFQFLSVFASFVLCPSADTADPSRLQRSLAKISFSAVGSATFAYGNMFSLSATRDGIDISTRTLNLLFPLSKE